MLIVGHGSTFIGKKVTQIEIFYEFLTLLRVLNMYERMKESVFIMCLGDSQTKERQHNIITFLHISWNLDQRAALPVYISKVHMKNTAR